MRRKIKICVDFDGTLVEKAKFPSFGPAGDNAFYWIKEFQKAGAQIILYTMRCDGYKRCPTALSDAIKFCKDNGVVFDSINKGIGDRGWTSSPKVDADFYIDDKSICVPLTSKAPFTVDWDVIGPVVLKFLKNEN